MTASAGPHSTTPTSHRPAWGTAGDYPRERAEGHRAGFEAALADPDIERNLRHLAPLLERIRTLHAQQLPLQRRMVQVVDAYRFYPTGPIKTLFRQIDRALHELEALRRKYPDKL